MLTTVAALIIVLGLMVSLARYVRDTKAKEITEDLLHKLDELMQQYMSRHDGQPPPVTALVPANQPPDTLPDENTLARSAERNNREFLRALRADGLLGEESFGGLPQSIYNDSMIRDAWGSPIVFMPAGHQQIGEALQGRPFFFSAGPDRLYGTQENNLYSYEK